MPSFKHVFRVGITAASRTKHNPIYCMNSMLYHCSAWPPRSQLIKLWSWKKQTNTQLTTDGFSHSIISSGAAKTDCDPLQITQKVLNQNRCHELWSWNAERLGCCESWVTVETPMQHGLFPKGVVQPQAARYLTPRALPNDSRWCHFSLCVKIHVHWAVSRSLFIYIYKSRYIEIQMIV